ncbi:hypothetical protein CKO31_17175, partial [Thiohalocapsa halophila]|nr:hypothetical protein [Thiohalocapsa halophila]
MPLPQRPPRLLVAKLQLRGPGDEALLRGLGAGCCAAGVGFGLAGVGFDGKQSLRVGVAER